MKHTDQDYLDFDPCEGDEAEISCRTVALRKAKKEHPCFFGLGNYGDGHTIKPGDRYRYEQALVDGSFWGKYRVCIPCMDKYISQYEDG
jgi:hypothetical protein